MEKKNHFNMAYLIGMVFFLIGISLVLLALYLIPYGFFHLKYDVPTFIINASTYLAEQYHITNTRIQMLVIIVLILVLGTIALLISSYFSRDLDKEAFDMEEEKERVNQALNAREQTEEEIYPPGIHTKQRTRHYRMGLAKKSQVHPAIVVLSLILLVFVTLELIEWLFFSG